MALELLEALQQLLRPSLVSCSSALKALGAAEWRSSVALLQRLHSRSFHGAALDATCLGTLAGSGWVGCSWGTQVVKQWIFNMI